MLCDAKGVIRLSNQRAQAVFGAGAEPGQSLDAISSGLKKDWWAGLLAGPGPSSASIGLPRTKGRTKFKVEAAALDPASQDQFAIIFTEALEPPWQGPERDLFEAVHDAAFLVRGGVVADCNQRALDEFRATREQMLGRSPLELMPPVQADGTNSIQWAERMLQQAQKGRAVSFPGEVCRYDGSCFQAEVSMDLFKSGKTNYLFVIIRDVSARCRAEQQLLERNAYLDQLVENSYQAIVRLDADDRVQQVNPEFTRLFGYTQPEAAGHFINDLIVPPQRRDEAVEISQRAMNSEAAYTESKRLTKDGRLVDVAVSGTPIVLDGQVVGIYAIYHDISRRKGFENSLLASEERFRRFSENAPDIVYALDLDGVFTYVNPSWQRFLGHAPEDVIGKRFTEFAPPGKRGNAAELLNQVIEKRRTVTDRDLRLVALDGGARLFSFSGSPNLDSDGRTIGAVGIFRDITARRLAQAALQRSESRYRALVENAQEGVCVLQEGLVCYSNRQALIILGFGANELVDRPLLDLVHPEDRRLAQSLFAGESASGASAGSMSLRLTCKNGQQRQLEISGALIDWDGDLATLLMLNDVTEKNLAQKALVQSEASLARAQSMAHLGSWELDFSSQELVCSHETFNILGLQNDGSPLGLDAFLSLVHEDHQEFVREYFKEALLTEKPSDIEYRLVRPDGEVCVIKQQAELQRGAHGRPRSLLGAMQDITELRRSEEQLSYQATHDGLTGMPNRMLFMDRLSMAMAHAGRKGHGLAVLYLDLDDFKRINDALGHAAGDVLLKSVAERLSRWVREEDTVARLGGDDFAMLMQSSEGAGYAVFVAQRIQESLHEPFRVKGRFIYLTASIGITDYPLDGEEPEVLLSNAELAMYRAKESGRDNCQLFTPSLNTRLVERMALENSLRGALAREEFLVHYQPKVDLANSRVVGVEALVRWQRPTGELVQPGAFIPLAEETGLIVPIGEWVLRTACRQTKKWHNAGFEGLCVAVNLSPRQFQQKNLVQVVREILEETGLEPSCLEFEVTENVVMRSVEEAIGTLTRLSELGVQLALDDFGRGYSSLYYLKRLPMHTLKIDRFFMSGVATDQGDASIVNTIISMSRSLNLKVVAEGVETQGQLDFLKGQHCDQMQGFLFSRPVPPEEIESFLTCKLSEV